MYNEKTTDLASMKMTKTAPLIKMNGIGNKILVIDRRASPIPLAQQAVLALAANQQTEFDQIMEIAPPRGTATDAFIDIWNKDGTKARACGNGMRCVVAHLAAGQVNKKFQFETPAGLLSAQSLSDSKVEVDMGQPTFDWHDISTTRPLDDTLHVDIGTGELHDGVLVSMGNPHVTQDVKTIDLATYGPILEHDPLFADRANISIAQVVSRDSINLRVWERGAGLTLACGTAACATVVAAVRRGLSEPQALVHLPGGSLQIEWRADTNHVLMRGETTHEFSGQVDLTTGDFIRD